MDEKALYDWEHDEKIMPILTSKMMGLWLGRRNSRLLDRVAEEVDRYLLENEFGSEYRNDVMKIIGKYKP